MDASQWPQHHQVGGLARTMEEIQGPNNNNLANSRVSPMVERKVRPQKEQNLNCPRCNSTNTKFCYYNNYSLTQPRYFCKTCRRYWTQGGSLRNVPVGGGSRKNKRSSSSSPSILASSSSSMSSTLPSKLIPDLNPPNTLTHLITPPHHHQSPSKFLDAQDLNLAFPTTTTTAATTTTALELLRSGMASRGGLNSYVSMSVPDPNSPLYPSGLPNLQEFKPSLGIFPSSHGGDHGNNNSHNRENSSMIHGASVGGDGGARLLFPFADMNKLASSANTTHNPEVHDRTKGGDDDHHHHHHQNQHHHDLHLHHQHHHHQGPTGYWNGMLGGGAW